MKKISAFLVASLLGLTAAINGYKAPLEGKFFYAQIMEDDEKGLYIPVTIGQGDKKLTQNWHITNNEHTIGVLFESCLGRGCYNSRDPTALTYDGLMTQAQSQGHRIPGNLYFEPAMFVDNNTLYDKFLLGGYSMRNTYNFTLQDYARETIFPEDTQGFLIYQMQQDNNVHYNLNTNITGYLGIQPYTVSLLEKDKSFLYQLKYSLGYVDHLCISFYRSPKKDGLSLVKFGSYDKNGMSDSKQLKLLKTEGIEGWNLPITDGKAGSTTIFSEYRSMQINPQYQYSYIPLEDFKMFAEAAANTFSDIVCNFADPNNTSCYFEKECSQVEAKNFDLTVNIKDSAETTDTLTATQTTLLIDGKSMGREGTCYLGIFSFNSATVQNKWYVGANLMSQKYYFFDMGPYVEDEKAYFAIGMGPINPVDLIGEAHYDYNSNNFMPEQKSNDMSRQIYGTNPYDTDQYERGHQRRLQMNSDDELSWYDENRNLLIVLVVLGVFVFISFIVLIIYCFKQRKIRQEEDRDKGLTGRGTSVNFQSDNLGNRLNSINAHKREYDAEISLDSTSGKDQNHSTNNVY